jgi:membrane protein DedA with SNARE-associated domain
MFPLAVAHLLATYGYGAVLLFVAIESIGIPFPGETMLLVAAIDASTTHQLSIGWVIGAAASGAILGDNLGYWIGMTGGAHFLLRHAQFVRRTERKLKLGLALFQQHGGKVVFFGRFVTVLRLWAAVLAGISHLRWSRFLFFNASGAIVWATAYGLGSYLLGTTVYRLTGPLGWSLLGMAGCMMGVGMLLLHRQEQHWEAWAVCMFPGPLEQYIGAGTNRRITGVGLPKRNRQPVQNDPDASAQSSMVATPVSFSPEVLPQSRDQQDEQHTPAASRTPLHPIHLKRLSSSEEPSPLC